MGRLGKMLLLAGLLSPWYFFTSPSAEKIEGRKDYPIPQEIRVVDTSLPYETREKIVDFTNSDGNVEKKTELEKIVKTEDIDFSKDFEIKTDRYRLVKDDDWLPSRFIGHIMAMPFRIFLWDGDVGWGNDEKRARAVLSMLEQNKDIEGLTVRLNHNEAFYDLYRIFTDKKLRERNNFIARATLGTLTCLKDEIWAELFRGDYYNPLSKTVVVYSNLESIAAHEIGHHKDFSRFSSDWEYSLFRLLPPVMLYQEWKASTNAKEMLGSEDKWQFNRYLMPAFLTYVLATYGTMRKFFGKGDDKSK